MTSIGLEMPPLQNAFQIWSTWVLMVPVITVCRCLAYGERTARVVPGSQDSKVRTILYPPLLRSEEHTSELQSLMRISYAVFCLKKKITRNKTKRHTIVLML